MQAYIDSIQDEVGAEASLGSEDLDRARCPQYCFERAYIKKDDRKTISENSFTSMCRPGRIQLESCFQGIICKIDDGWLHEELKFDSKDKRIRMRQSNRFNELKFQPTIEVAF